MTPRTRSIRNAVVGIVLAACLAATGAAPAHAAYGIDNFSFTSTSNQAGAHPDVTVDLSFAEKLSDPSNPNSELKNDEQTRDLAFDIPAGITGHAEHITPCRQVDFNGNNCPPESQVGVLSAKPDDLGFVVTSGVWVLEPRNGSEAVRLGSTIIGEAKVNIVFSGRSDSDLGLHATAFGIPRGFDNPTRAILTLWGVPADASHDNQRYRGNGLLPPGPLTIPSQTFVTNPTQCGPQTAAQVVAHSFENPDVDVRAAAAPTADITACDLVPFMPALQFRALTPQADSPSAFDATIDIPKQPNTLGVDASHVRRVDVTLPEGVAVSPPAAATLGACADADLKDGTTEASTCPASSRLGDAQIDVPILRTPLSGGVYLRPPTPGHLFRLAVVVSGVGVNLRLLGETVPDPITGRLHAVFDNAPQQPVTSVRLRFKGGPGAPLATPQACTPNASTVGSMLGWSGALRPVSDVFAVSSGPGGGACPNPGLFAPAAAAGTTGRAGGGGALSFRLARPDGQPNLGALRVALAPGVLGRINTITPCSAAAAAAASCPASSRIGTTTTGAGSGPSPLYVKGPVYLTGPYKGAPFGLSIVVPTAGQAGPFDLGNVAVRAALSIDPRTAQVRVDTDPLPQILQGVPLRLRDVRVAIDRPRFIVNPTDCSKKRIDTRAFAAGSSVSALSSSPFQVGECSALGYKPKLGLRLTGMGQTKDGRHPGLLAKLRPRSGDANTKTARVTLPSGLALDPQNAEKLCEPTAAARNACPKQSIVGRASAVSILHRPVRSNVYFVRGERRDKRTGRTVKTLPKLYIPLSGEGVRIDVNASSAVSHGRLVAAFSGLPDVPLDAFDLRLEGGAHGIIAVSGTDICKGTRRAAAKLAAHNGRAVSDDITLSRPCR